MGVPLGPEIIIIIIIILNESVNKSDSVHAEISTYNSPINVSSVNTDACPDLLLGAQDMGNGGTDEGELISISSDSSSDEEERVTTGSSAISISSSEMLTANCPNDIAQFFFPGLDGLPFPPPPALVGMCWTTEKKLIVGLNSPCAHPGSPSPERLSH